MSLAIVGVLYLAGYLDRRAANQFSTAASMLLAAVAYGQADRGLLTMTWGTLGLGLLAGGFVSLNRALRWQGLGLLLACILKLFFYDLRNLETPYRILSFVSLELILMSVSWIYTRFRDQLRRLL